jgi:predicted RNA binding protein YcfA (HicA-like mRNA interferase family)
LSFSELTTLAEWFGFMLVRMHGSHHFYRHDGVVDLLNLQNVKGKAKDYQVRQLLALVESYGLIIERESGAATDEADVDDMDTENMP